MVVKIGKPILAILFILVVIMMSEAFSGASFAALLPDAETAFNTTNLIRLHIMANSDSPDDQSLKTVIRDTVLREVKGFLMEATTKPEVWQILSENISRIEDVARDKVDSLGKCYDVTVELGTFSFPACSYGNLQVPAGDYDAIRVILGKGTGQNWWCVLFPPLCFIEVENDGRIRGLDTNTSPGEALLKLELLRLDLNSESSLNSPRGCENAAAIPILQTITCSTRLSLSLNDFL